MRLNKFLAERLGVSRREADELILAGRVRINEATAVVGQQVLTGDAVAVDGRPVAVDAEYIYIMLNKPAGYVCSRRRQGETPTLYELLPEEHHALKTVGRLDANSSGLILLTNDGDFAYQMTHPSFQKTKVYLVLLDRALEPLHQQMIGDFGVELTDGRSRLGLTKLDDTRRRWQVEMSEGRNRQIRRTFRALGYEVDELHRVSFGPYQLGDLPEGEFRQINK